MKVFLAVAFCLLAAAAFVTRIASETTVGTSVQGKVLDSRGGQPLRKVDVQLKGGDGQPKQYSGTTDADGEFKMEDVTPGRYVITAAHTGFVQSGSRKHSFLVLQAGQKTAEIVIYMLPAALITGKIVDSDGDPMSSVTVSASRVGTGLQGARYDSGMGTTNDLGEFRIADLHAGRYLVTATPPRGLSVPHASDKTKPQDKQIYTTTYYPGTLDKQQSVAVEVHSGDEVPINFALLSSSAYRLSGTVSGLPQGAPLAEITLSAKGQGQVQDEQLREGGKFDFENVLPGTYSVAVITLTDFSGGQPSMKLIRIAEPIEVSNANVEGLRLHASANGGVKGRFRMDTEEKFNWTQLTVMLIDIREEGGMAEGEFYVPTMSVVDADGTFGIKDVPGGTYRLVVGAKANNLLDYFTRSVSLNGRDVSDSGFVVNGETFLDVVVSAKGATIEGRVVDDQGAPVAYATVVDVPSAEHEARSDLYQRGTTSQDGRFSLRGLNPGKYTVLAFEDLQEDVRQPEFLKSYEGRGAHVQVEEASRANVTLKVIGADDEGP